MNATAVPAEHLALLGEFEEDVVPLPTLQAPSAARGDVSVPSAEAQDVTVPTEKVNVLALAVDDLEEKGHAVECLPLLGTVTTNVMEVQGPVVIQPALSTPPAQYLDSFPTPSGVDTPAALAGQLTHPLAVLLTVLTHVHGSVRGHALNTTTGKRVEKML